MNKPEAVKLITHIQSLYPGKMALANERAFGATVEAWGETLCDLPLELAQCAVRQHAVQSPFPPTIAEIRSAVYSIQHPDYNMNSAEAWRKAVAITKRYGHMKNFTRGGVTYHSRDELAKMSPAFQHAFNAISYETIIQRTVVAEPTIRAQFMKAYEQYAAKEAQNAAISPQLKARCEKYVLPSAHQPTEVGQIPPGDDPAGGGHG